MVNLENLKKLFYNILKIRNFGKFQKFLIWKIPKISNLKMSKIINIKSFKNFRFRKFLTCRISEIANVKDSKNFKIGIIQEFPIFGAKFWFPKLQNSENLLILQFGKFQKLSIKKIQKMVNLENSKNVQF